MAIVWLTLSVGMAGFCQLASGEAGSRAILDEARALPDAVKERLEAEIRRFTENTGCELQLVTTTFLSGKTVRDHANALSLAQMQNKRGVILVYDRATDAHAIAPSNSMWESYPTPSLVEAVREAGALVQGKNASLEGRLEEAARRLMERVSEIEKQRQMHGQLLPGHDSSVASLFLLVLVCGAGAFAWLFRRMQQREAANAVRYFFPQVEGAIRFGAPYGGGVIAEVRVSPP